MMKPKIPPSSHDAGLDYEIIWDGRGPLPGFEVNLDLEAWRLFIENQPLPARPHHHHTRRQEGYE